MSSLVITSYSIHYTKLYDLSYNQLIGSGNFADCGVFGEVELRHTGFMLGNVVDMFKFEAFWPEWMPFVGGEEVFPAIWNTADASYNFV